MEKIMIQIMFSEKTKYGEYSDALYLTPENYATMKKEDIDGLKQERINNWIKIIEIPPVMVEPTKEELEQESITLDTQIAQLQDRKAELWFMISSISIKPIKKEKV